MISMQRENRISRKAVLLALASVASLSLPAAFAARIDSSALQAGAPAAAPAPGSRLAGTVTAISGSVLTVKDDKGTESKVTVADSARILQLPAGEKSLSAATPINLQDIAVGDRILAKTTQDGDSYSASLVVAMKQADIAQMQQRERQEWQTQGIRGLVKSVDPAAQTVTVTTGNGPTAKTIAVQVSKTTNIRRYAPDSTKFDDAKPATLDEIKPGDQLRAKGPKNADGTELDANAIIAGTFRSIDGTVISVDAAANSVTVTDLATKKPLVINVNADSQLHKLPPTMAQGIAMRLKGGAAGAGAGAAGGQGSAQGGGQGGGQGNGQEGGGNHASSGGSGAPSNGAPAAGGQTPSGTGGAPGQWGGDIQQVLNRAPVLQLADLKKGDALMVLTTEGQTPGAATAVILLAGVEPLLQASPSASQSVLSASWSLGGGAAAAGQDAQ